MADERLSAEQLDNWFETISGPRLVQEIRASWAELETTLIVLGALVHAADRGGYGVIPSRFSESLDRARALVGSVPQPQNEG